MKSPNLEKLDSDIKSTLNKDPVSKKNEKIKDKKSTTIQKSYSLTEYHSEFLMREMASRVSETGKNVSVSEVLRSIIDFYIARKEK